MHKLRAEYWKGKHMQSNLVENMLEIIKPKIEVKQPEFANYAEYNSINGDEFQTQYKLHNDYYPLVSIAVITNNSDEEKLIRTLDSIKKQTYSNIDVCVALGANNYKNYISSLKCRTIISTGNEAELMNEINGELDGDFMLLLVSGDIIKPDMVQSFIQATAEPYKAEVVFSDEEFTENGVTYPLFKPDYGNISALTSNTYGRVMMISKRIFNRLGGYAGFSNEQCFLFNVRAMQYSLKTIHIAKILCVHDGNNFLKVDSRLLEQLNKFTNLNKKRKKEPYLKAEKIEGTIRLSSFRKKEQGVSIIIPNIDNIENLGRCIESIQMRSTYENYRIFIANKNIQDEVLSRYLEALKKTGTAYPIDVDKNLDMPSVLNQCVNMALNNILIFLNGSSEILTPDFIEEMVMLAELDDVGAVGGKITDSDDRIISIGDVIGLKGWAESPYKNQYDDNCDMLKCSFTSVQRNVTGVCGAFMAVKADKLISAGMFDETFSNVGWDTELCIRLSERGYNNVFTPFAKIRLYGELPDYESADESNLKRCYDVYRPILLSGDKYYNPNFDYASNEPCLNINKVRAIELNPFYKS